MVVETLGEGVELATDDVGGSALGHMGDQRGERLPLGRLQAVGGGYDECCLEQRLRSLVGAGRRLASSLSQSLRRWEPPVELAIVD